MIIGNSLGAGNGAPKIPPPAGLTGRTPDYVCARDIGLFADEVRRRYPWAVEYHGFNGPCWRYDELGGRE
jgi:hypothetical protein